MKQKLYTLGLVTTTILFLGTFFKVQHWPGAFVFLTLGIASLVLAFIPLALRNHYKAHGERKDLLLYWVTWITCLVIFIGMLFKIQHWQGAGYLLLIALPFPYLIFLPVFLAVTSRNKAFNIYNTVYVLFLMTAFSTISLLLALNVSNEVVVDSLRISGNYYNVEKVLDEFPVRSEKSEVSLKIDEALKTVVEYKNLELNYYKISPADWEKDPEILMTVNSWQRIPDILLKQEEPYRKKLHSELTELISIFEKTPGYEKLAETAPVIFGLGDKTPSGSFNWKYVALLSPVQPWWLIYLDGLGTNLKMIKTTL